MKRALLLSFLLLGCCQSTPPTTTVVVASCDPDAGLVDEPFEADQSAEAMSLSSPCAKACASFSRLGCPESRKPAGGRTCVETCKAIEAASSFSPACVAAAASVEAVRKCPAVRCLSPKSP